MLRSFFIMFIMIMAAPGTILAEEAAPCSVDMVPIQIMRNTGRHSAVTTLSEADLDYSTPTYRYFSFFVKDVTEYLATKLAQENLCLDNAASREYSLLQFLPWRIDQASPPVHVPPLPNRPLGVCRISSPWMDLIIERKPIPLVRGIFRYNERQLLADQAVLEGARNVPPGVALPLTYEEFDRLANLEYAASEIRGEIVKKPIEERVPPDLLWLFRRAWQDSTPGKYWFAGLAASSMRAAMKAGSEGYTQIVTSLVDRCFESEEGVDLRYNSILDIDDSVLLEQYKIVTSIVEMPER